MSATAASAPAATESTRLTSMDAYRGFVMLCLAAGGFGLKKVSESFPDSPIWREVGYQFEHVAWVGCAFWDLIQPSFMFLVGVAMPYSFARREKTESSAAVVKHVLFRSLVLILLGLFLSSVGKPTTDFSFMNVLTQIGLGYPFLFLLRNRGFITQLAASILILGAYWAWFASTPVVPIENLADYKLPENWVRQEGFNAHWEKHVNPAAKFDQWFLNLFPAPVPPSQPTPPAAETKPAATSETPAQDGVAAQSTPGIAATIGQILRRLVTRTEPYVLNNGGYQTLNFIPSLVTMLFGLMTGEFIRRIGRNRARTFLTLLFAGLLLLGLGWGWQQLGGCPLVKRIWTPSWTLFSTGWTLLILSGFYGIIDGLGWKAWSFPLVVAGMNSMVLYMMGQLLRGWTSDLLKRHLNENIFTIFGSTYSPIVQSTMVMFCFWLFVYWLYRQRIFVRI